MIAGQRRRGDRSNSRVMRLLIIIGSQERRLHRASAMPSARAFSDLLAPGSAPTISAVVFLLTESGHFRAERLELRLRVFATTCRDSSPVIT